MDPQISPSGKCSGRPDEGEGRRVQLEVRPVRPAGQVPQRERQGQVPPGARRHQAHREVLHPDRHAGGQERPKETKEEANGPGAKGQGDIGQGRGF